MHFHNVFQNKMNVKTVFIDVKTIEMNKTGKLDVCLSYRAPGSV